MPDSVDLRDPTDAPPTPVTCRAPVIQDGPHLKRLATEAGSLDVNSTYSYLLVATHFAATSAVATLDERPVGFVSGYLKPADAAVLFIWQVAVHPDARGQGVARRLLNHVLDAPACADVRFLEATVTPSNTASWALFQAVASERGAPLDRGPGFQAADFGGDAHENETLVRIGPLRK